MQVLTMWLPLLFPLSLLLLRFVRAVDPFVSLSYATYRGRIVGDGTTQWQGMRYAAPPVRSLRFAPPQDPVNTTGIQDATKFGSICLPQNPNDWSMKPNPHFTLSEDCLFINVFAPSNATTESKLPVMFFIQGGGFGSDSNANYNGSDIAREGNIVLVSLNYRVGSYGFLQSREVDDVGGLNNGLKDIVKGLEWVRDNVRQFGGDPDHVVLNGDSAGAMAIVLFLLSPKMRDTMLFVGAIAESAYVGSLPTPEEGQKKYECLLNATGCSNTTNSLVCLRSLNASALQTASCSFGPHIDNDFITDSVLTTFSRGTFLRVPTIFGSTANEGTKNSPQQINTTAEANTYFLQQCPSLSNTSLATLDRMYITNHSAPVFANSGRLWRQVSNAVSDFGFHCPIAMYQNALLQSTKEGSGLGAQTWSYRYSIRDPMQESQGYGAYHTVELYAVWGPNNTDGNPPKSYYTTNAGIVPLVRGYWISFVRFLDPNVGRLTGAPIWGTWGGKEGKQRLSFLGSGGNETRMEAVGEEERRNCEVLEPMVRCMDDPPKDGVLTELNGVNGKKW